jgi:hypothetical protein
MLVFCGIGIEKTYRDIADRVSASSKSSILSRAPENTITKAAENWAKFNKQN